MTDFSTIQTINEFCSKIHDLVQHVCNNSNDYDSNTLIAINPASLDANICYTTPPGYDTYHINSLVYDNYPNYEAINSLATQYILFR